MKNNSVVLCAIAMMAGFFIARNIATLGLSVPASVPVAPNQPNVVTAESKAQTWEFALTTADIPLDREYPTIATDPKSGTIVAAWAASSRLDSGNTLRTLWTTRSTDGGRTFDKPVAFREVPIYAYTSGGSKSESGKKPDTTKPVRPPMTFSTHLLPRLVAAGDRLVLAWVEALDGGPRAALYLADSTDGGLHFNDPVNIAGDQASRPGFISISNDSEGRIVGAWLDNPQGNDKSKAGSSGTKVFVTREKSDRSGFESPRLVYTGPDGQGVCPCCDVAVNFDDNGRAVYAFRNNVNDIRDIWLGQMQMDKIQDPIPISDRKWNFAGCPHDGPSMIIQNQNVTTAWMDARDGKPRIFLSDVATDLLKYEAIQTRPVTDLADGAQSHAKLISDNAGGLFVAWDQSELKQPGHQAHEMQKANHPATSRGIVLAHRPAGSQQMQSRTEIISEPDRLPRNPTMTLADNAIVVAWAELGGPAGKSIRLRRVEFSELQSAPTTLSDLNAESAKP